MIFHICTKESWGKAATDGVYEGDTLSTQGFIHCSAKDQIVEVANHLFKGRNNLILLCIDDTKVNQEIKYEEVGEGEPYPHIYGPLNIDAVLKAVEFPPEPDGTFKLPSGI